MENKIIKILAIDDNPDNLVILHALIKEAFPNAVFFSALNGKSGIDSAINNDPDMIFLDIVMPDINGFEVCNYLKSNNNLVDTPVIFLTALKDDNESRIHALEVGGEGFLSQPIDESELIAQIRSMVKIKEANVQKFKEKKRLEALVEDKTTELRKTYLATLNLLEDLSNENEARKKTELELIEAKNQAELANKLKDAFIANISHEIRTPLNGILGMTTILKDIFSDKIGEEDKEIFEGINISSKRIIRTVDMILNYSRLQIGEFNIRQTKISISQICHNLIKEFIPTAKYRALDLSFQNDCGDAVIMVDEFSITMAISNLVDNAIKYTKQGFVRMVLKKGNDNELILDIIDSGIGIDKEYLKNIFKPYSQEHMGYGRAYEGIGLGLAIVQKVLKLNNCLINVTSEKGKGSTFSINFGKEVQLFENNIALPETANKPKAQNDLLSKLIMIVEDDLMNQFTTKRFLVNIYRTVIADSSEDAREILKKEKVDLILMDISIKGTKNGLELTKELKSSKDYSHIPVIAVTAHAFEEDKQNTLNAGCDNYISKPFTKELLLNMISVYLNNNDINLIK